MFRCKVYHFFMDVIPLKAWRSFLLRRHFESCPACLEKMVSPKEAKSVLYQPEETGNIEELWSAIEVRLTQRKPVKGPVKPFPKTGLRWKHGLAAAGLALVLLLGGIWIFRDSKPTLEPGEGEEGERFHINYLKMGDEPADPIIYKPFGSDLILIWVEKHEKNSSK